MKWGDKAIDREPHSWFAWRPVRLEDNRWAWLEKVERERAMTWSLGHIYLYDGWIYRSISG